ncbi:MAG: T9SS type A sorting domain-containing protein [Bacteroidota bacterium]|nr:T9SS type A sorting domain-containing protein [Bacteroidota bacterium]
MKAHVIILSVIVWLFVCNVEALSQISYGGKPWSYSQKHLKTEIDHIQLRSPDVNKLLQEAITGDAHGQPPKVGRFIDVDINMDNAGSWAMLEDGRRLWRLQITSKNAQALSLIYESFDLPKGSQLYIYSPDKIQTIGAFNHKNNANGGDFATEMIYGESLILEYISPHTKQVEGMPQKNFSNEAEISIKHVNYVFRYAPDPYREVKNFGSSGSCNVNVNCSEGDDWQQQKKGVARILFNDGTYSYYCTGSLVNNTYENGTPYFLSAYHCGGDVNTGYYDSWTYYFNYESSGCSNGTSEPSSNTITGCDFVSSGPMDGGSDFLLVELNQTPPSNYNVVYNGWDRSTTSSGNGVSIHHPSGDIKKISTYTSSLQSATYNGGESTGATNACWRVYWTATTNGHGITEGGSSGSPIFKSNGLVMGTLSGGTSGCENTNGWDLYGKFSYHWNSNGSTNTDKLEPWLDPANTGTVSLNFYDPNNTTVTAGFTSNTQTVTEGGTVNFTSTSTGTVENYAWSFEGGSPSTSSAENPSVTYNTEGTYNVSLTVSGNGSEDTHSETDYITVNTGGTGEDCTWLNYPLTGTPTVYTTNGGSGYVAGNNSYGDLSKTNYFEHSGIGYVFTLGFHAAYAEGTSSTIDIAVWDEVGGSPGNLLGSKSIPMSTITNNFTEAGDYFEFAFDSPIEVNGDFFAGIVLPEGGDIFALFTNTDGDSSPGTAWEQFSDRSWYPYYDGNSWELAVDHAIYPEVCANLSETISSSVIEKIQLFPNPGSGNFRIHCNEKLTDASISVYNYLGETILTQRINHTSEVNIDISDYPQGMYFIQIHSEKGDWLKKYQLIK